MSIRIRSVVWFAAGITVAVVMAAVFVGVRSQAAPGAAETTFVPIAPCRLFDYRPAPDTVGTRTSPLGPAEIHTQQVTGAVGKCNVPATATGVSMNVTIVGPTAASFLALYPSDLANPPTASNLNWAPNQVATPNKVDVKLSPTGAINLLNGFGTVYVLADVVGYYTNTGLADLQAQLTALRSQTMTLSGRDLMTIDVDAAAIGTSNGCAVLYDRQFGYVPFVLPLGATLSSVTAEVFDPLGSTPYSVDLERRAVNGSFEVATSIATVSGGAQEGAIVVSDITPPGETVDAGERFTILFDDGVGTAAGFGAGLCSVTVSYRLPGG